MPRQSLLAMKVAFGLRAQYTNVLVAASFMVVQVIGVVIFAGSANASTAATLSITTKSASGVNANSAVLNLQTTDINNSQLAQYGFEYGTTTDYGSNADSALHQVRISEVAHDNPGYTIHPTQQKSIDSQGNLYEVDGCGYVYKFNSAGTYLYRLGGGCGSPFGGIDSNIRFDDQDNVYFVSEGIFEGALKISVFKYSSEGTLMANIGQFSQTSISTQIAIDQLNNVYVFVDGDVYKYDSSGSLLGQWNVLSAGGIAVSVGSFGMATDSSNNVYIGTNTNIYGTGASYIKKFNSNGDYIGRWSPSAIGGMYIDGNDIVYITSPVGSQGLTKAYSDSGSTYDALQLSLPYNNSFVSVNSEQGYLYTVVSDASSDAYERGYKVATYATQGFASVGSLTCNTTYHYRAKVEVPGGSVEYGQDQQFTTAACPVDNQIQMGSDVDNGQVGFNYLSNIYTNATSPNFTLIDGELPPGLTMANNGHITGTPTQAGIYLFELQATDNSGIKTGTATQSFVLNVYPAMSILNTHLEDAIQFEEYRAHDEETSIQVWPAYEPVTYSIAEGSLPPGLSMDSGTGIITGTPDNSALGNNYVFTVEVHDGQNQVASKVLSIYVYGYPALTGCGISDTDGTVGFSFYATTCTTDGFGPKSYELAESGTLPPGLSLDPFTGEISGTPTTAGDYTFTVTATDLIGSVDIDAQISIASVPVHTNTPIVTISSPSNNASFDYLHDDITITGTGPANRVITTYMDGIQLGTATVNSEGGWSYVAHNVFPGHHSFDAKWIPGGDVAFLLQVDPDNTPDQIDSGQARMRLVVADAATQQQIKTVYLPNGFYTAAASINHAGTKVYMNGFIDRDPQQTQMYIYDIASGSLTSGPSGSGLDPGSSGGEGFEFATTFSGLTISQDDTVGYKLNFCHDCGDVFYVSKFNLQSNAVLEPLAYVTVQNIGDFSEALLFNGLRLVNSGDYLYALVSSRSFSEGTYVSSVNTANGLVEDIRLDERSGIPIAITNDPAGHIYVGYFISDKIEGQEVGEYRVAEVDSATNTVSQQYSIDPGLTADPDSLPFITSMAVDSTTHQAYLFDQSNVHVLNLQNGNQTLHSFDLNLGGGWANSSILSSGRSTIYTSFIDNTEESMYIRPYDVDASTLGDAGIEPIVNFANTHYIGSTVSPSASVAFSVGTAPIIPPTITDEPKPTVTPPDDTVPPDTTVINPAVTPAKNPPVTSKPSSISVAPITSSPTQQLFALVKRIPEPIAIGFPWLLILLALVLVAIQYYQVHSESLVTARIKEAVAGQKRLVDEQNNFVALSTHYLHTPLTIMEGEITLMVKAGTLTQAQATKLKATLTSLNAEAESVLAQEEQHESDV